MTYELLPDVALADVAFRAKASSPDLLFETCAGAMTDIMVDRKTLSKKTSKTITLVSEDLDRLLYDFLTELIVIKDVDSLLFREFEVKLSDDHLSLTAVARGEPIDRVRHALRNDVKAVTMHMFGIKKNPDGWESTVVLDI